MLHINTANPTVSTIAEDFVRAAHDAEGWAGQNWDDAVLVDVVTLDGLIARYGVPAFIKIDVEGSEDAVLRGLSHPVRALSFEFTTIARDVAMNCLDRLCALADHRYNVALGESQTMTFERWLTAEAIADHLSKLPHAANSGDVYARIAVDR